MHGSLGVQGQWASPDPRGALGQGHQNNQLGGKKECMLILNTALHAERITSFHANRQMGAGTHRRDRMRGWMKDKMRDRGEGEEVGRSRRGEQRGG